MFKIPPPLNGFKRQKQIKLAKKETGKKAIKIFQFLMNLILKENDDESESWDDQELNEKADDFIKIYQVG
ncbi:unnamed protein product [Rhizophagus irregularis]|nr:unnamed protein product [Rhizophagus irregularis]